MSSGANVMCKKWSKLLENSTFALTYEYLGSDLDLVIADCMWSHMNKLMLFFFFLGSSIPCYLNLFYELYMMPNYEVLDTKTVVSSSQYCCRKENLLSVNASSKQWRILSVEDCTSVAHLDFSNEHLGVLVNLLLIPKRYLC